MSAPDGRPGESGFTLIELLLVIALLGAIVVPLTGAILIGLRTTDDTRNRLDSTHDAQLVTIYLPADLQSAGSGPDDVTTAANTDCSGKANLLTMRWTENAGAVNQYTAVYSLANGGTQLVRSYCLNGVIQAQTIVARNLASDVAPVAAVAADGKTWTLTVTERANNRDKNQYVYSINGIRRTLIP